MAKLSSFKAAGSNILEQLAFNCTGDTMSNSFGTTMTAENVTAAQNGNTTTYTKVNGSEIAYTPPAAATRVIYEFRFQHGWHEGCLLYTSPSPRDNKASRMPSSA